MFRKYKIKKRKKGINLIYLFLLIIVLTLFMSYGYAYWSDSLKISGKANILSSSGEGEEGEEVYGDSTYSSVLSSIWGSPGSYTHSFTLTILNMDQDFTGTPQIELSFDLVEGLVLTESSQCNIWQAESITQTGSTVTIIFKESDSWLSVGSSITLHPHFEFEEEHADLQITNLKLNGKLVQAETST